MPTFGDENHGGHVNGDDVDDGRVEVEALIVDRYLDTLLAGHDETGLAAGHGRAAATDRDHDTIDPAVRAAADVLRRSLVRVHPSFQFEERLSARLSAMTTDQGDASRLGALIPFRSVRRGSKLDGFRTDQVAGGMEPAAPQEAPIARRSPAIRPLLIGGALTSAALSLAGVAWFARRTVRTPALAELEGIL